MATEAREEEPDAPTTELLAGAVGDRCANCEAPLARDQSYCLECGERRGKPRFSYAEMAARSAPDARVAAASAPPARPRFSSGATLIAGVATLLLAMGVGVLIGQAANGSSSSNSPAYRIITVGGGGAPAATTANNASSGGTAAVRSTGAHHTKKAKPVIVHLTAKTKAKAAAAASQVIGSSAPKNPTIQPGQSCAAGQSGCQNGKFTGNFFGGG
jgi:hypothetical protein